MVIKIWIKDPPFSSLEYITKNFFCEKTFIFCAKNDLVGPISLGFGLEFWTGADVHWSLSLTEKKTDPARTEQKASPKKFF